MYGRPTRPIRAAKPRQLCYVLQRITINPNGKSNDDSAVAPPVVHGGDKLQPDPPGEVVGPVSRHNHPLIRSSLLAEFPGLVRELDGPLDRILEEAGLSLAQLEQPTLLIPLEKETRLLHLAARHCRFEAFAMELAARQDIAVFGALSLLIVNCGSVLQGLQMLQRHLHHSAQGVEVEVRQEGELAYFIIDSPLEAVASCDQFWDHSVGLACNITRMLCGPEWAPRSAYLRRPEPVDSSYFSRYLRCPMAFDSDFSGLVFERRILHQPVSESINRMPVELRSYLSRNFHGDFLAQIRRVINSLLPTGDCTADTVAMCMGYSLRTLQRKLNQEQTSFQQQIDRVRSELAVSYLQEPQFSLTDITELLGFAEPSVFSRGFKRWFGETPSRWRARELAGGAPVMLGPGPPAAGGPIGGIRH